MSGRISIPSTKEQSVCLTRSPTRVQKQAEFAAHTAEARFVVTKYREAHGCLRYDRRTFLKTRGLSILPVFTRTFLIILALLVAHSAAAQNGGVPSETRTKIDVPEPWEPVGAAPVDEAGDGGRGYALVGDNIHVGSPGSHQFSLQTVASNHFYREQTGDFLITERYETHTVALGYRRGFDIRLFPRFEFGGQLQLAQRDNGFLNGFISGFESLMASISGQASARNELRTSAETLPPPGTYVVKRGQPFYHVPGSGSGFGDFSLVAKALLRERSPSSRGTRVAARVVANIAGTSAFSAGTFAGIGVSVEKPVASWIAFSGDVRATAVLDRVSRWNLPLKRESVGFSIGSEMKLTTHNSLTVQIDGSTTPYLPTGSTAFDKGYGDITIGLGHRSAQGRVVTHIYARENMNLPFRVRWNLDPDMALGVKTIIRLDKRGS